MRDEVALRLFNKYLEIRDLQDCDADDTDIQIEAKNVANCIWDYVEAFMKARAGHIVRVSTPAPTVSYTDHLSTVTSPTSHDFLK